MDIYWIENKQRLGPEPEVVIVSKLQRNEITPGTLAWHKGCSGWIPVSELPALASYFKKRESIEPVPSNPDTGGNENNSGYAKEGGEVRVIFMVSPSPYIRLVARFLDLFLYQLLILALISLFSRHPVDLLMHPGKNLLIWSGWIVIEATMLRLWGTTPGKKLCGIRVYSLYEVGPWTSGSPVPVPEQGKQGHLSFTQALGRSIQVMLFGMGFMIQYVMLITGLFSLFILRKTGTTIWDNSTRTVEIHKGMKPTDWVTVVMVFCIIMIASGSILAPWLPELKEKLNLP